jgi:peptidoglycan-associated lipoprotein
MKTFILTAVGVAGLLSLAGCHKVAPVAANHPADTTPVAPAPRSTPATPRSSGNVSTPSQRASASTPQNSGMPSTVRQQLNEYLARMEDALFDYDKATIRTDARTALADDVKVIRDILAAYPSQKLLIEGNADERGSEEYNMALGDKRARAAEDFLASMNIPSAQLTIVSFGKDRPVCTDKDEACWQKNRRAHLTAAP